MFHRHSWGRFDESSDAYLADVKVTELLPLKVIPHGSNNASFLFMCRKERIEKKI